MYFRLRIFDYHIGFSMMKDRKNDIFGYTNRCDDGKFIVFLDYDELPYDWIESELKYLQQDFKLGNFYVFESSKDSYHAVCFTKVKRYILNNILLNSSIDENYTRIPFTIGKKLLTLRLTEKNGMKPRLKMILFNKSNKLESYEHKKLFNKLFNCIDNDFLKYNNDLNHKTKLILANYKI